MKYLKYLGVLLVIAGALAVVGWYLRNTIIERISGPLLAEFDLEIVDVSLDALAPDQATISRLELLHDKTTIIRIRGLRLPIGSGKNTNKHYWADSVTVVTSEREDDNLPEFANLVSQFLSLTEMLPQTSIEIATLTLAPYPVIQHLNWQLLSEEQRLNARIGAFDVTLDSRTVTAEEHDLTISILDYASTLMNVLELQAMQRDDGIQLDGGGLVDLLGWESLAKLSGIMPANVHASTGSADLVLQAHIPSDVSRSPAVSVSFSPLYPWRLEYASGKGGMTMIGIEQAETASIIATLPSAEWTLTMPRASLLVTDGDWVNVPVTIAELNCSTGPSCSMKAGISWQDAILPFGSAQKIDLTALLSVSFAEDAVAVEIAPDAAVSIQSLSTDAGPIDLLEETLTSKGNFSLLDSGWTFSAASVDSRIRSLHAGERALVSSDVFLENVNLSDHDGVRKATAGLYTPALRIAVDQQTFTLPGYKGDIAMLGGDFRFNLETVGLQRNAAVQVLQNTDTGNGSVSIDSAALSFSTKKLSTRVTPWSYDWDLIAGVSTISARANWTIGEELVFDGQVQVDLADVAGFYADTAVTGLSTRLDVAYSAEQGFTTKSSSIDVALIDLGLPIHDVQADYLLDINNLAVDVENLRMTVFGGQITADPFSFHTARDSNNLVLHAEMIQLDELLSLKEFEAINVTGTIGATLPVTIGKDKVTIAAGTLLGNAPGGVIRYRSGNSPPVASTSSMDLVTRALSNFVYETLTSELDYNDAGDLVLKMQVKGRNPDMEGNRPVILNLSVENNIPQMLKSLQAARAVEDVLEKRVGK